MQGDAVKEIERLAQEAAGTLHETEGGTFSPVPLHHLPRRREEPVDAIELSSLQGVVDYLTLQRDGLNDGSHFIHIEGPTAVRVVGPLLGAGSTNQRHVYLRARVQTEAFPFGGPVSREAMQILLQARFGETKDRERALRVIGNLVSEDNIRQEDDGVTQRVTVKGGVQIVDEQAVKNPFLLAPYRTFPEIDPPPSPFVLRLEKAATGVVNARLIEADGGAWKVEAVARIRAWLKDKTGFQTIS
jgi:hypothetical protein